MRLIDVDDLGVGRCSKDVLPAAYCAGWNGLLDLIEKAPTVDAVPVVYGRWAHLGGDEWCCSACGFVITTDGSWDKPTKKYCEDCGAKMDGGNSDDNDEAD